MLKPIKRKGISPVRPVKSAKQIVKENTDDKKADSFPLYGFKHAVVLLIFTLPFYIIVGTVYASVT